MKTKNWLPCLLSVLVVATLILTACAPQDAAPVPDGSDAPDASDTPEAPEVETIKWQVVTVYPDNVPTMLSCRRACDIINSMSGGRLELTAYPGGAIVPALSELEAVEQGTVEAMYAGSVLYPGRLGNAALIYGSSFPGGPNEFEYSAWWYHGGGAELEQRLYDEAGTNVVVAGLCGGVGPELFGWFNKPIESVDDFKGLKFRTIGIWGETLKKLGASVVTMSGGELYQALERGVLDAFEYSTPATDYPLGFYEIADYVTVPGTHQPHSVLGLYAGKDAWNDLTPELQSIVRQGCAAATAWGLTKTNTLDAEAWQKIKETDVEVVVLPKEVRDAIVEAASEVIEEYSADDPLFDEVVHSQLDFLELYRTCQLEVNPVYYD